MGTLRVAFLSGAVLELAATLGIALVAVTVGVRLVDGGIGFEAGARRAPARAGALPAAAHARQPSSTPARMASPSPSGCSSSPRRRPRSLAGGARPPVPAARVVRLEGVSFAYPARDGLRARRRGSRARPGRDGRARRPEREREEHARLAAPRASPSPRRAGCWWAESTSPTDLAAWRRSIAWVPQRPTIFRGTVADNIRLGDAARRRRGCSRRGAGSPAPTPSSMRFPTATRRESATGAGLSAGEAQRIALARAFAARRRARRPRRADGEPRSRECGGDRRRRRRTALGAAGRCS